MSMLEQTKQEFLNRQREIERAFYKLHQRMVEIPEEIGEKNKERKLYSSEITAEALLTGDPRQIKIETEYEKLVAEKKAVEQTINKVMSKGGIRNIFRTDKELDRLAVPVIEDLKKEAQVDAKKRMDIEKRYEKLIQEIITLDDEWKAFEEEGQKKRNLLSNVQNYTSQSLPGFDQNYKFGKSGIYYFLRQAAVTAKAIKK